MGFFNFSKEANQALNRGVISEADRSKATNDLRDAIASGNQAEIESAQESRDLIEAAINYGAVEQLIPTGRRR